MSRRLIVCIDGTNNYPSGGYTNIQRLCRVLERSDVQQTYYQPGVGTIEPAAVATRWGRRALMLLDSASAVMLERHVCAAYRYLMANHRPGDELYFLGFSRGAYAVRVLAGMLAKVGLLHAGFDEMVAFAWDAYTKPRNDVAARQFRDHYARDIPAIRFIGLFDTVSAVGLPWVPRTFPLTYDNPAVVSVRHAQALDEHRAMFVQNSWARPSNASVSHGTDVKQVWFAGVHSDIGGSYPEEEAGLSRIPLAWMIREATAAGLTFDVPLCAAALGAAVADGMPTVESVGGRFAGGLAHDELRRWVWKALEWLPFPRRRFDVAAHAWTRIWQVHRSAPRRLPRSALIHESVRQRVASGYRPRADIEGRGWTI